MVEEQKVEIKKRKLKKFHILIVILGLFLLVGIIIQVQNSKKKSSLQTKIEKIRAAGYPISLQELDQTYSIPDNVENAADFISDAVVYYQEPRDSSSLDFARFFEVDSLSDETMKNALEYFDDNQKTLGLLQKAAALQYCRYPVNLSINQAPKIVDITQMVKLLDTQALVYAENNDREASINSLINSLKITDTLAEVPFLICQFGKVACYSAHVPVLERMLNKLDFTEEQLAQLSDAISERLENSDMSSGLKGELCRAIDNFGSLATSNNVNGMSMQGSESFLFSIYRAIGLIESDGIMYLDSINRYMEVCNLPLHERMQAAEKIQAEMENVSKFHVVFNLVTTNYSRYFERELTFISQLRVAQTAIAVQRYRLKYNKLPDSLNNLVPEFLDAVPLDPYDGKELRYKKLDSGFVVYGIDQDLFDDNGQEEPKSNNHRIPHWDITFTIKK